jgi:hypothetical protein
VEQTHTVEEKDEEFDELLESAYFSILFGFPYQVYE